MEIQGHRGARGYRPENTLPSIEMAIALGVDSIEIDLLMTADEEIVVCHDFALSPALFRGLSDRANQLIADKSAIANCSLAELRDLIADGNPEPLRFPEQKAAADPFAKRFAATRGFNLYTVPTLEEVLAFIDFLIDQKPEPERERLRKLILDLEIKAAPFLISFPSRLIQRLIVAVQGYGWTRRCRVRSFDHRVVREIVRQESRIEGGALVAGTAPCQPAKIVEACGASLYLPDYRFLHEDDVRGIHRSGFKVIPWTVNDPAHGKILCDWGVDGLCTDFPDRLRLSTSSSALPAALA